MNSIDKIRYILNTLFLIGAAVTIILYIAVDKPRAVLLCRYHLTDPENGGIYPPFHYLT